MAAGRDRTRLLKGFLLVIGILILGGIVVLFFIHRHKMSPDQSEIAAEKKNATIAMRGIRHTDFRDVVKDWELEAESADYRLEENRAYLSNLKATYVDNDGDNVFLSAESGIWMTDSNDLEVSGNVVLKNSVSEMRTDRLIFNKKERIFVFDPPVEIRNYHMTQVAEEGMTYSLDTGSITGDGIKGKFGNGI